MRRLVIALTLVAVTFTFASGQAKRGDSAEAEIVTLEKCVHLMSRCGR